MIDLSTVSVITLLALVPTMVGLGVSLIAGRSAIHLPPRAATVMLTLLALTVAGATGLMLCLACYIGLVHLIPIAHPVDWSIQTLQKELPIPAPAAVAAGALATALLVRAGLHLARTVRSARQTAAAAARLPAVKGLAVVEDSAVNAYAVPGRHGRIVVSTGMLHLLSGPERRALLAHEQAHLRHHHYCYSQLARLAAAANPFMHPVARAVDTAIERWADADAVREVGNPAVVAHALGVAALARPIAAPAQTLGAARNDVVERVRDLLEPPPRHTGTGVLLAAATAMCWVSTAAVVVYTHGVIQLAEAAHR